jgi:tetratricopeptide (TPR) repeat protein
MRDLGELYEQMGRDDDALNMYRQGLRLVTASNWLYRDLQSKIVGVYRRTDRLDEFLKGEAASWRNPTYDQAMLLAGVYEELGREDDALNTYLIAQRRDARNVDPRMKIIQIHQRRGNMKAVYEGYQTLIRISPREPRYQFELARLYFRDGDRKRGLQTLKQIQSRFSRDADVLVQLADMYMRFDLQNDALAVFQQLVRNEPRNETFLSSLGEFYYQNGQVEKALETWMRILRSDLPRGEAYARLGEILIDHEMVDRGIGYVEQARQLAPNDRVILRALALAYERDRRWDSAVELWLELMRSERQPTVIAEARGRIINIYLRQDKLRTKMREFELAFRASPPDVEAGFFLAEGHVKLGAPDKAERIYRELVELDGKLDASDIPALVALERVAASQGKLDEAIKALQQLAELRPQAAKEYYHRIAELSLRAYDDDQAVVYARKALDQNPDDAAAHGRLGDVWAKMQRYDEAIKSYREAIDLDPRAFQYAMALAELLAGQGERGEALKLYEGVIQRASDEGQVLAAGRRALALARDLRDLESLENTVAPLVFRSPPRPAYRTLSLELYTRMLAPLIAERRFGAGLDSARSRELDVIAQRAFPVLMDAAQSEDAGQRQASLRLLGELGLANAAAPLGVMVEDARESLRLEAGIAVARIADPRSVRSLIRAMDDANPAVRDVATWAVGATGAVEAVPKLAKVLKEGSNAGQQTLAAISLGRLGGDAAGAALLEALESRRATRWADPVSSAVVWALGAARYERATVALIDVLSQSPGVTSGIAAWSLGRVGTEQAVSVLLRAYWSAEPSARAQASRALTQLTSGRGAVVSREERYREMDQEVRFVKLRGATFDTAGLLRRLVELTELSSSQDAEALLVSRRAQIVAVARGVLEGSSASMKLRALADLNDPQGALGLGGALSQEASAAMREVRRELAPALRALTSDADVQVRAGALLALGSQGMAQDLELLLGASKDDSALVRKAAVKAMGAGFGGSESAQARVVAALKDPAYEVRSEAARALQSAPRAGQLSALIACLSDPMPVVRLEAARSLGALADRAAIQPLAQAIERSPREVQIAVLEALAKIDHEEAREVLKRWSQRGDPALRGVARRALTP